MCATGQRALAKLMIRTADFISRRIRHTVLLEDYTSSKINGLWHKSLVSVVKRLATNFQHCDYLYYAGPFLVVPFVLQRAPPRSLESGVRE